MDDPFFYTSTSLILTCPSEVLLFSLAFSELLATSTALVDTSSLLVFSSDGTLEHNKFSPTMPFSVASMIDSGMAIVTFDASIRVCAGRRRPGYVSHKSGHEPTILDEASDNTLDERTCFSC